ncbi:MAG: GIY-YIG nuclease family protein [Deltaproteobacteria bacterium]|nr:GIY-YIG nuclease family protein [Deltaproteobacteria bacterium]NIS78392.1 GIY-YIG nuclease family protein [Deltaproteobacteria bacterium]
MPSCFYILRLESGRLYCGATKDIKRRVREHFEGIGCRTTKGDPPVELVYFETFDSYSDACKREAQVKRWPKKKKELLLSGDIFHRPVK